MPTPKPFQHISDILPIEGPMVLLEDIEDWDDQWLISRVDLAKPSLFSDETGRVPAWLGLEYMAQSIGALAGIQALSKQQAPEKGFFLGTREYQAYQPYFESGTQLRVHVKEIFREHEIGGVALFDCKIYSDALLAEAQIKMIKVE